MQETLGKKYKIFLISPSEIIIPLRDPAFCYPSPPPLPLFSPPRRDRVGGKGVASWISQGEVPTLRYPPPLFFYDPKKKRGLVAERIFFNPSVQTQVSIPVSVPGSIKNLDRNYTIILNGAPQRLHEKVPLIPDGFLKAILTDSAREYIL